MGAYSNVYTGATAPLKECGDYATKGGEDLAYLVDTLRERYDEWCVVDEDEEREDYEYEMWLDRLEEIADELREYGHELFDMEWKEPQE